jgi:hydroxymethylpyrimidine pyrophosphatase-like HAD family hydrolase
MTDKYALFFDIDGTLVSFNTHQIPYSTVRALTDAKANGAQVYIATGRPLMIITNLGAIEHLIDGYITTSVDEDGILNALKHLKVTHC